jgi:TetR/AcrR family transcriptional repressor of nem operon
MKRAGLTQGGFYFHFSDKDALISEAARDAALSSAAAYVSAAESAPSGEKLKAFVDSYLSAEHRAHPESGCIVSALAGELGRGNSKQRAAFTEAVSIILERVSVYVGGATARERRQNAGLLLASMAGVLNVSRVLADPASSDALLARAREFFTAAFGKS